MTFRSAYNERKATHLSAYLLQKSDGEMFLLKLMKLLYLVDRTALVELGHTVTCDNYVSMDNGPVLSHTFNLMNGMVQDTDGVWNAMISPRNDHKLSVADQCEVSYDALSEAEMEIADRIFKEYGHIPRFDLANMTHDLPEWQNPEGSSIPILYENILRGEGYDDETVKTIIANLSDQKIINELVNVA